MYDEIILDRAVQLAAKNGWDGDIERSGYAPLIFNKDFARALWGDEIQADGFVMDGKPIVCRPMWQIHLREMVIAPDPIKYLSDHMP